MGRRILPITAMGLVAVAILLNAVRIGGVHLAGDLASEIRAGIAETYPGSTFVADPGTARIEVILVTDWEKLSFVPGAYEACGDLCLSPQDVVIVLSRRMTAFGMRKLVAINISGFLSPDTPGVFSLSPSGRRCLVTGVLAEMTGTSPGIWPDDCIDPAHVRRGFRIGVS